MTRLREICVSVLCLALLWCGVGEGAVTPSSDGGHRPDSKGTVFVSNDFEESRRTDWGIGHDIWLPVWNLGEQKMSMTPRNDGGDWKPFYWEDSGQGRAGQCLEIRIVNPSESIRGCGVDMVLRGSTALPPDKEVTVTVWTNCISDEDDFAHVVLAWEPGDHKGVTGGVQDYVTTVRRSKRTGWEKLTLRFRSHKDTEVGDMVGLAFGARTSRPTEFRPANMPKDTADCRGVVAVQPVLSAFFDDFKVIVHE